MQRLIEQRGCWLSMTIISTSFSLRNCRVISLKEGVWLCSTQPGPGSQGPSAPLETEGSGPASCHSSRLAALCYKAFSTLTWNAPGSLTRGLERGQHCHCEPEEQGVCRAQGLIQKVVQVWTPAAGSWLSPGPCPLHRGHRFLDVPPNPWGAPALVSSGAIDSSAIPELEALEVTAGICRAGVSARSQHGVMLPVATSPVSPFWALVSLRMGWVSGKALLSPSPICTARCC